MALSANTVWEIRTTGADTNGGGFVAGSVGTDYSQQNAAQVAVTDAVANGTTTITSATAAFNAAMVGNTVYLVGGSTPLVAVRRQVVTYTNATTIVLDAVVATGTGITLNLGGCLASLNECFARGLVGSNMVWIATGTYVMGTITSGPSVTPAYNVPATRIRGYNATRGDITISSTNQSSRPNLQPSSANLTLLNGFGAGYIFTHLQIGGGTYTLARASFGLGYSSWVNVKVTSFTLDGLWSGQNTTFLGCEFTGGLAGANEALGLSNTASAIGCNIHDNACPGITAYGSSEVLYCRVVNNTGASSDGIQLNIFSSAINNTVYGNGRHGINIATSSYGRQLVQGNILANNGGYGLTCTQGAGLPASIQWDGNAYYSNTSGNRNNVDDTTVYPVNGVSPYINQFDINAGTTPALTISPFMSPGSGDFTLNSTAGGGASVRGNAPGNSFPGSAPVGYRDFGSLQHQDNLVTMVTTFIEG